MEKKEQIVRLENDPLGNIIVPFDAYFGSQTQRAIENFPISGMKLPREFIWAQGIIKAASAKINVELSGLDPDMGNAIIKAAEEVTEGKFDSHFVVDIYQAGAGTSQNNNVNEIIAKRAMELMEIKAQIHPNDHVNMSQSTNDTFPSALNIAAIKILKDKLLPTIYSLYEVLKTKSQEFNHILKAGRTHLHDGIPIRLGQEFEGYAQTIFNCYKNVALSLESLYCIGLGGQAIGTKLDLHPDYKTKIIKEISERTKMTLKEPENIFAFMQNMSAPLRCMASLKELATHLIKITSDLRLLSSGPRTGFNEITLPSVQPGSTIMPGKVNPAMLEMTHMVCCQIIGYETAVTLAVSAAQLEINVFMPLIAHSLLHSLDIINNAINILTEKCIKGIAANEEICKHYMFASLALVTGLRQKLGYDGASHIGLEADINNKTIKEIMKEKGLVDQEYQDAINPNNMV